MSQPYHGKTESQMGKKPPKDESPKRKRQPTGGLGFKKKPKTCWDCKGTGSKDGKTCPTCGGAGEL
jgi:DnaJ-class molecular chaperone